MVGDVAIFRRLRNSEVAVESLAVLEFDLSRTEPVEPVRLTSGDDLEAIAGDGAGGTFFLCGRATRRPVLYTTSEGQAGLIAPDLTSALELIVGMPLWCDCLKFSAGGELEEMRAAASRLESELSEYFPDLNAQREALRAELVLGQPSMDELLARLHASVKDTEPEFNLAGPDGGAYAPLFNTFRVSDNPAWR